MSTRDAESIERNNAGAGERSTGPGGGHRRLAMRLGMVAIVFGLGVLVLECVARVTHSEYRRMFARYIESDADEKDVFCQFDDSLGWRNRPNVSGYFARREFRHHVRHNEYGLRGGPIDLTSARGRPRVLALGDSFTWGYGVEEDETYCKLLSQSLDIEVLNLGVSGFGTGQELLLLQDSIDRFDASAVVLFFDAATDLRDLVSANRWGHSKPRLGLSENGGVEVTDRPEAFAWGAGRVADFDREAVALHPWFNWLAESSTLFNVAVAHLAAGSWRVRQALQDAGVVGRWVAWDDEESLRHEPGDEIETGWRVLDGVLAEMKRLVDDRGMQLVVVHLAGKLQVDPPERADTLDLELPSRRLESSCDKLGVLFVDTLADLRVAHLHGGAKPFYRFDPHLTPAGHSVVAQTITRTIRDSYGTAWLRSQRTAALSQ